MNLANMLISAKKALTIFQYNSIPSTVYSLNGDRASVLQVSIFAWCRCLVVVLVVSGLFVSPYVTLMKL